MRLIMLGAPGTGKGTQGKLISQRFNIPNISTGDILREAVSKNTRLGQKAKSYLNAGDLVPDEIMIGIIRERLKEDDCQRGFILDGFPRTVEQAEALDGILAQEKAHIDHVISLEVDRETLIRRLTSRRVCSSCGKDYNIVTNPPPETMKCGKCGGEIMQRMDDEESTIIRRLQVYEERTQPLKNFYLRLGKLRFIPGEGDVETVFESVQKVLWHR